MGTATVMATMRSATTVAMDTPMDTTATITERGLRMLMPMLTDTDTADMVDSTDTTDMVDSTVTTDTMATVLTSADRVITDTDTTPDTTDTSMVKFMSLRVEDLVS